MHKNFISPLLGLNLSGYVETVASIKIQLDGARRFLVKI